MSPSNINPHHLATSCMRAGRLVRILLRDQGLFRSILSEQSIDGRGDPIPWITYPALEFLSQLDLRDKHVFEYGAGNSSLFWAERASSVTAVEADRTWFERLSSCCPPNLKLILEIERDPYVSSLAAQGRQFDLIVIDGRWRNACLSIGSKFLAESGLIVLDNSDRNYAGAKGLLDSGYFRIDFSGFSPINGYASTTSVFFRPTATFHQVMRDPRPVGGLSQIASFDD